MVSKLKKSIASILLCVIVLTFGCMFIGCGKTEVKTPEEEVDETIEMEDGVNVVIDVEEADALLNQAKLSPVPH